MRGTRFEVSTVAFDPALQGVGSDINNSPYNVGLRIPTLRPVAGGRYVFMLARAAVKPNQRIRLVGMRQLLTMRADVTSEDGDCIYPMERSVDSPWWHFIDGSVSWHLRRIPPATSLGRASGGSESFGFQNAQTPALIGTTSGGDTAATYTQPPSIAGIADMGDLGTFYGIRFPWHGERSQFSMDFEIEGPCDIALYATVLQTDPETRCNPTLPPLDAGPTSLAPEDAFVANFPNNSVYGRIAGSLIFDEELGTEVGVLTSDTYPKQVIPRAAEPAVIPGVVTQDRAPYTTERVVLQDAPARTVPGRRP